MILELVSQDAQRSKYPGEEHSDQGWYFVFMKGKYQNGAGFGRGVTSGWCTE